MTKWDKYISMSGYYRGAECFEAYRIIGFSHDNKNIPLYEKINLTYNETRYCGNYLSCGNYDQALAGLKHIIRQKDKIKNYPFYTIGFVSKNGNYYVYMRGLKFKKDCLKDLYSVYRRLSGLLTKCNWKITYSNNKVPSMSNKLGYNAQMNNYLEIDKSKLVFIKLTDNI